jgi:hypothetical protein
MCRYSVALSFTMLLICSMASVPDSAFARQKKPGATKWICSCSCRSDIRGTSGIPLLMSTVSFEESSAWDCFNSSGGDCRVRTRDGRSAPGTLGKCLVTDSK